MSTWKRSRNLIGTAALLVLTGCDGLSEPQTPGTASAPTYDRSLAAAIRLVQTSMPSAVDVSNSQVIGSAGGVLRLGLHELSVPRAAVARPTMFTMTAKYGKNVIVDLSATDMTTGAAVTAFPVKLQIKLSYSSVPLSNSEVKRLLVVWLRDNTTEGALVPVRSTLLPNHHYVVGWVDHFSQFAMGMN